MNAKIVRIGLIGSTGRFGKAIAALRDPSVQISALYHRAHPADGDEKVDLFLDVSTVSALPHNLQVALLTKKPIVIGTTGHPHLESLKEAARSIPVFYAANFSLGMALMQRAAGEFARRFHRTASIALTESHHADKKDAPSGSALIIARSIEKTHPAKVEIQSIRSGQIVGKHELHFRSFEEHLTLVHEAQSRDAFARGALEAARFLAVQSPGFYTMDDLIK